MKITQEPTISIEALDLLGHGVCLYDPALAVRHWNGRLRRLGVPALQAEGCFLPDVLAELGVEGDRLGEIEAAIALVSRDRQPVAIHDISINFPAAPRSVFDLCIAPQPDGGGAIIFRNATEALRLRETFERILDSTPDGLFVIDNKRSIRFFNQACSRITGRPVEEILGGCECSEVIHCHNQDGESYAHGLCPAKAVFRGELDHQREEMLLRNAAGEERWIETTYSPVRGPSGEVEFVVGILRDVHERKMLEEKLNQTEKLATLGQLVAGIAHEINNPLAAIRVTAEVMAEEAQDPLQKNAAEQISRGAQRCSLLVANLLSFARRDAPRITPTSLNDVVETSLSFCSAELRNGGVRLLRNLAPENPVLPLDRLQLEQAILNLVNNAFQAFDKEQPDRTIRVGTEVHGEKVRITVEDNGPGISHEMIAKLFEPFHTTKGSGTGLGLSLCKRFVESHGGTVRHERSDLGGAGFIIEIPVRSVTETTHDQEEEPAYVG